MSLLSIVIWSTLGLMLGLGIAIAGAGTNLLRDFFFQKIIRSNKDGWVLVQRGKRYALERLTREEDADAWRIGDEEEAEWVEDPADLMHSLHGVPFGLKLEQPRQVVDVEAASVAEESAQQVTDGGELSIDQSLPVSDIRSTLKVGELHADTRTFVFINPYVETAREKLYDLRNVTKLFRYDSSSDTPRKSAKNAKEAERAFDSYGSIKEFGKVVTAFMLGAIATYIGGTGGGGGGGGGAIIPMTAIDVTLGVF
jgi:hypothetical protein